MQQVTYIAFVQILSLFLQVYINSINLLLNLILPTLVLGILNYRIYKALSPGIEKVHFCLILQLNFVQFYFVFGYSGSLFIFFPLPSFYFHVCPVMERLG